MLCNKKKNLREKKSDNNFSDKKKKEKKARSAVFIQATATVWLFEKQPKIEKLFLNYELFPEYMVSFKSNLKSTDKHVHLNSGGNNDKQLDRNTLLSNLQIFTL